MLTNDKDRATCNMYEGNCSECPLVKEVKLNGDILCKQKSHYDRKRKEWVYDPLTRETEDDHVIDADSLVDQLLAAVRGTKSNGLDIMSVFRSELDRVTAASKDCEKAIRIGFDGIDKDIHIFYKDKIDNTDDYIKIKKF